MRVLLVDDEAAVRAALSQTLDLADIPVEAVGGVAAAMKATLRDRPGVVITDMRMGDGDGFQVLDLVQAEDPDLPVIVLTGHGDVPMAVKAMNGGAYDFIEKPASPGRLIEVVRRALALRALVIENRSLRTKIADLDRAADGLVLGDAPASRAYRDRRNAVAAADADVLVLGETGAGKEGAARAIHALSERKDGPFVAVNCGALPPDIAASELFGHEAGAFTGATTRRVGRFEQADGGVIFLDEIESMPLDLQVRLLRVLQEREVERLGASAATRLDIRVVAATKVDLRAEAAEGRFREDLYYRLDVARITVPPLRERLEDAPLLFATFLDQAEKRRGRSGPAMTPAIAAAVQAHNWPGNVRELKNAAERFAQGLGLVIGSAQNAAEVSGKTLTEQMDAYERAIIEQALDAAGGRVAAAAEALGVPRKTLYDKLAKYGLKPEEFR